MVDDVAEEQPVGPSRRSAIFSVSATWNGSTSYGGHPSPSAYTGSGASSTGGGAGHQRGDLSDRYRCPRRPRTASSGVITTPDAKPHAPPWITRTAKPRSSVSFAPAGTRHGRRGSGT